MQAKAQSPECMLGVQGIGLDMLADTVRTVQPSHVLQLHSRVNNRNLPENSWWRPHGGPGAASVAPAHFLLPAYEAAQDAGPPSNPAADSRGEKIYPTLHNSSLFESCGPAR